MTKPIRMAQIALPCALMLVTLTPGAFADQYDKMTNVTISQPIEVPGAVLQPGTYTFKLLDEPSDRHIVQISSLDGKHTYAIVFTAAARRINVTSTPTLTFYEAPSGQPQAVNKWFWPGEQDGQQFLYSHEEAQKIDQASGVKVPEAPPEASQSAVAQNTEPQNAPQAQQSQATPAPAQNNAENNQTSQNNQPQELAQATPPPPPANSNNNPAAEPPAPPQVNQPSTNEANPNAQQSQNSAQPLPQTASDLPLIALIGFLSLAAGAALRGFSRIRS